MMSMGEPVDHESSGPEDTHYKSSPRPKPTNWRNRYRIGGIARPTGPCMFMEAIDGREVTCPRMGFEETTGMCPEHFEEHVIEPMEADLREQREHWLAACAAAGCLKKVFTCSCGLKTDLFDLEDSHLPANPTHSRMFPVRGEPSTAMPRSTTPRPKTPITNDIEEFG